MTIIAQRLDSANFSAAKRTHYATGRSRKANRVTESEKENHHRGSRMARASVRRGNIVY